MSPAFDVPRIGTRSVTRPRLLDALDGRGTRPPLTIVHGPAGSGKSTLLAQWARAHLWVEEDLVWVTMYPDAAGVVPFWTRIAETLVRARIVPSDFELGPAAGEFTAMLIRSLGTLKRPITLVLDDYHLVSHEHIDGQLRLLLNRLDNLSVVIGTRTTGRLHSIETAARLGTAYVDAASLAFTLAESDDLVTMGGLGDREGLGRLIHTATDGWPLASQALIMEAHRDADSPLLQSVTIGRSVFAREYAQSTLMGLADDARGFLLRLSFADETTAILAGELTEQSVDRTNELLAVLERDGVGTWQSRSGTEWFRLHPLLREALETEAHARLDAAAIRSVRAALAAQIAGTRPLRALELLILIEDWAGVERLALLRWVTFSFYNRAAFAALLRTIPPAAMRAHPGILALQLVEEFNDQAAQRTRLARRHAISVALEPRAPEPTVVAALRDLSFAGMHRLYGDLPRALIHGDRSQAELAAADPADVLDKASSLPTLYTHVALGHYFDRQNARGITEMIAATASAERSGSVGERLLTVGSVAFMYAMDGQLDAAREWIGRGEETDPYDGWVGGYLQAPHLVARAFCSVSAWDAAAAVTTLDLLRFTEPAIEFWPWMAFVRACADTILVGPAAAHAALSATNARAGQRPRPVIRARALLIAIEAELLRLSGQPSRAQALVDDSGLDGEPEVDLVRARLASASRNDALAVELAVSVVWASAESPGLRAEALLTLASSAYAAAQHDRAVDAFTEALTALNATGARIPLLWIGTERIEQLVALARGHGRDIADGVLEGLPPVTRSTRAIGRLTASEIRVLGSLRDGGSVAVTAAQLFLSPETVRFHLKSIYKKLGVSSRDEALAVATELGLLG